MNISIFGAGYVGLVTGACLANLGHRVTCADIDEAKIQSLYQGIIPFYEPGLKDMVCKNSEKGRLRFTTNIPEAVAFGEVIFNCVGTPSNDDGSANLQHVFDVAVSVARFSKMPKILINKSTVPPGTARKCHGLIQKANPSASVDIVSNPEFLAEGKAVHDFTHPDKIVVGAQSDHAFSVLRTLYMGRVRTYIPLLETDWETAELIKYANNSFLATKISFINEIANICDHVGADVKIVAQALGMDYRINPKFLNAGAGYGGSCLPKDVRALVYAARERGYNPLLLAEVNAFNERQKEMLLNKIQRVFPTLREKTITVWGLSFKPNTSDVREAPSLAIIKGLLARGASVRVYDPIAQEEAKVILSDSVTYCSSLLESVHGSSAILLATEWDEFRQVNLQELGQAMAQRVLFDGRNVYEPLAVKEEGFKYYGVGRQ